MCNLSVTLLDITQTQSDFLELDHNGLLRGKQRECFTVTEIKLLREKRWGKLLNWECPCLVPTRLAKFILPVPESSIRGNAKP